MVTNTAVCENNNCQTQDGHRRYDTLEPGRTIPPNGWVRDIGENMDGSQNKDYCSAACWAEYHGYTLTQMQPLQALSQE